jgi:hypothetical protein
MLYHYYDDFKNINIKISLNFLFIYMYVLTTIFFYFYITHNIINLLLYKNREKNNVHYYCYIYLLSDRLYNNLL